MALMRRVDGKIILPIGLITILVFAWAGFNVDRLSLVPAVSGAVGAPRVSAPAPERALAERLTITSRPEARAVSVVPRSPIPIPPPIGPDVRLEPAPPPPPVFQEPSVVRGVYSTGWIAGSSKFLPRLLSFIRDSQVNALVVDIKDDTGTISYQSRVPLAVSTKAGERKVPNMEQFMQVLHKENIYPIARIVAFKDPHLAVARPDLAVKSKQGGIWKDRKGQSWVDPHNRDVWKYLVDLAKEAAALGFKEIQYDYIRFASDGKLSDIVYPYANGKAKKEVIKDFLAYARKELEPYGIVLSADVFGLVCSVPDDLGIGQQIELIAEEVDLICPMVYPSHYYPGSYGLANPNSKPYETVLKSLKDAQKRIAGKRAKLRPWLQDFSLGYPYHRAELQAQIRAANDAGIETWLFWNPACKYDLSKY